jgi:hypothetical protein
VTLCRAVVMGSYHGAVLALSQGIPVVALSNSDYYSDKFLAVADQFGGACEVLPLDCGEAIAGRLCSAIRTAWDFGPGMHESLLVAARRQIAMGQSAYARFAEYVGPGARE